MNTKRNVLWISVAYVFYFAVLWTIAVTCSGGNWCDLQEDGILVSVLYFFAPLFPLLILSLITYKMRDEVFRAWWGFARWWVPVILAVTLFLSAANGGGGLGIGGAVSAWFDAMVLGLLHVVLVVVSLTKIVRTYLKTK